jgi:protein phosphatase
METVYALEMSALADTGRIRARNEDAIFADAECGVAILADGMGGYNAGEVAAQTLVSRLAEELVEWTGSLLRDARTPGRLDVARELKTCIALVNEEIYQLACSDSRYSGMGTTLVMGLFARDFLVIAHVGDSRCYRLRQGRLALLTHDHSLVQMQIDCGLVTPGEARFSSIRNLVTRAVGVGHTVESEFNEYDVVGDDIYLFCSDGLHDMLTASEIARILEENRDGDLYAVAATLVAQANARGGQDNISVILARVGNRPRAKD